MLGTDRFLTLPLASGLGGRLRIRLVAAFLGGCVYDLDIEPGI